MSSARMVGLKLISASFSISINSAPRYCPSGSGWKAPLTVSPPEDELQAVYRAIVGDCLVDEQEAPGLDVEARLLLNLPDGSLLHSLPRLEATPREGSEGLTVLDVFREEYPPAFDQDHADPDGQPRFTHGASPLSSGAGGISFYVNKNHEK